MGGAQFFVLGGGHWLALKYSKDKEVSKKLYQVYRVGRLYATSMHISAHFQVKLCCLLFL